MYSVEELKNILKGNNLPDTENNIKLLSEGLDNGRFILEDAVNLDETVNYMTEMYDKETLVKILKEEYETYNTLLEMSDEDFETYIMEASDDEFNEACLLLESDMYLINEENLAENEVLDSINLLTESVGDIRKRIRLGLSSLGIGGAAAGATIAANGVNPVAVPIATGLGAAGVAYGVHKLGKQIVDTNKARSNYATKNAANIAAKFRRDDGTSPVSEDDIKGYGLGKREMVKRAKANAKVEWLKNHGDERTKTQQNLRQSQKNLKIASKHLKNDNTGVAQQMMNQEQKKIDSAKAALKNYKNKEKEAVGNAAFNAKNDFKKAKEATKYYAQANGEGKKLSFWANHKNDLTENLSVDQIITLTEEEKLLNNNFNLLMESFYEPENEADVLNMKYSKNGEFLREYDYDAKLNNILKNGISTINEANLLSLISGANNIEAILESKNAFYKELGNAKNNIEKAKCLAESGDLSGYASLARATVVLDELTK